MGKINGYSVVALPKLDDKLVGTSVDGTPPNSTYNFTPAELLSLFEENFNAATIIISNVPVYTDNAAAVLAGLGSGQLYRTGDYLKVVH